VAGIGMTLALDLNKNILLNIKPLSEWKVFLDKVTAPENPDGLSPPEVYIHMGFRDLVNYVMENQEAICRILISQMLESSTKNSGSTTADPQENSQ
jgi:hypothetical protein